MVHLEPLPGQQDAQPAIAKPATLVRQLAQPPAQGFIAPILLLVLEDGPVQVHQLACPTLAEPVPVHHVPHGPSLHIGRQ